MSKNYLLDKLIADCSSALGKRPRSPIDEIKINLFPSRADIKKKEKDIRTIVNHEITMSKRQQCFDWPKYWHRLYCSILILEISSLRIIVGQLGV